MELKDRLEIVATVVLVACAILTTGVVVARETRDVPAPGDAKPVEVEDWERFAREGARWGSRDARVTMVVFSDFECPFCRRLAASVDSVMAERPNDVQVVFRHFPLDGIHEFARPAAIAAVCADGAGHFKPFHDGLFAKRNLANVSFLSLASQVGIPDSVRFNECLASDAAAGAVERDVAAGQDLGVTGTPTIIVNGWRFAGAPVRAKLDSIISAELSPAGARR